MVGPNAKCTEEEEDGSEEAAKKVVARPIVPLLLASYQFRQITLEILSKYMGIPLDDSGNRLQTSPWPRLAIVREYALTGSTTGTIVAELESIAHSSPTLAVYIFVKTALRQLERVPRMYNVTALTVGDSQFSHAKGLWEEGLKFAREALDKAPMVPSTAQPVLVRYAEDTLRKVVIAQRYGTLLTMLVRGVQVLVALQAYDAKRAEGDPPRLPAYVPHFLKVLRDVDNGTHFERKHGGHAVTVMPDVREMSNFCVLLRRVVDMDVEAEGFEECRALARTLKDEFEGYLAQVEAKSATTAVTSS